MSTSKRKKPIELPPEDPKLRLGGSSRSPSESRSVPRIIRDDKKKRIRVLIVDDQILVREGVADILSHQSDLLVVGEAENGIEAVEIACQTKPDVVLLDMVMPKQDGLETISKLKELVPESKILVLTSFAESYRVYESIKRGATGYILKDATRNQLLEALHDVANGQAKISPIIALEVIHEIDHPSELLYTESPLTSRELETLRLIARGMSNQEIAGVLFLHEKTVAKYVGSILNKLQVANRTQAVLYAIREGLIKSRDE